MFLLLKGIKEIFSLVQCMLYRENLDELKVMLKFLNRDYEKKSGNEIVQQMESRLCS